MSRIELLQCDVCEKTAPVVAPLPPGWRFLRVLVALCAADEDTVDAHVCSSACFSVWFFRLGGAPSTLTWTNDGPHHSAHVSNLIDARVLEGGEWRLVLRDQARTVVLSGNEPGGLIGAKMRIERIHEALS